MHNIHNSFSEILLPNEDIVVISFYFVLFWLNLNRFCIIVLKNTIKHLF